MSESAERAESAVVMERVMEVGMLVLAPIGKPPRDVLWTVVSVGKKSAKMVARLGYGTVEVTTRTNVVPDDWKVVLNADAVKAVS